MQLIQSLCKTVTIEIYCGCYITPPSLSGGPDGDECDFGASLTIAKDLWEDCFMCWCPKCGAELSDGYGIELVPNDIPGAH